MSNSKTFAEIREEIGTFLKGPHGAQLWDLMCALRGPDSPSERPSMGSREHAEAYRGRRERKRKTVEVIREKAFFGVVGGCARHHDAEKVSLPPQEGWDHFDRHVQRAAGVLGLEVEIEAPDTSGVKCGEVKVVLPPNKLPIFPSMILMVKALATGHIKDGLGTSLPGFGTKIAAAYPAQTWEQILDTINGNEVAEKQDADGDGWEDDPDGN